MNKTPIELAMAEIEKERFRAAVEAEKARLRAARPWWQKLFPYRIKIERITNV